MVVYNLLNAEKVHQTSAMENLTMQQRILKIIAANEYLYSLSSPEIIAEIANEKVKRMKPVIRKKRTLQPIQELSESEEEITKDISAIPIYLKNIIANVVAYVKQNRKYPTTQVSNFYFVRQNYRKFNKQQKRHYNALPEWETYLKLFDYYNSNQVRYEHRDYSLTMIESVKKHGLEMFDLVDSV